MRAFAGPPLTRGAGVVDANGMTPSAPAADFATLAPPGFADLPALDVERDAPAPVDDRRRSEREARHTPAWLSGPSGSPQTAGQHVLVTDLSLHGVGFQSDRAVTKGDACWIVIAGATLRLSTRVRLVNVRKLDGGRKWVVGAEFF